MGQSTWPAFRIIKRACALAGLDPVRYAGHSPRSGMATAAAAGGAPERAMVDRYVRHGDEVWAAINQEAERTGRSRNRIADEAFRIALGLVAKTPHIP